MIREGKAILAMLDYRVQAETLELKVLLVFLELGDNRESKVLVEQLGLLVEPEFPVRPELSEHQDYREPLGLPEYWAQGVTRDLLVKRVSPDLLEQLVLLVFLVPLEQLVTRDHKACRALQESKDLPEAKVQREIQVYKVPQDLLEPVGSRG